jgi:hypothetical protein
MLPENNLDVSFILDKIESRDLNGLRTRNREIVKVWARLKGFKNIQFKYIIGGLGFGKELIETIKGDFPNLIEKSKDYLNNNHSPIDLFIYREEGNEWYTVIIIDEYEIIFNSNLRKEYPAMIKYILSNFSTKIILNTIETTPVYIEKLLDTYSRNIGLKVDKIEELDMGSSSLLNLDII